MYPNLLLLSQASAVIAFSFVQCISWSALLLLCIEYKRNYPYNSQRWWVSGGDQQLQRGEDILHTWTSLHPPPIPALSHLHSRILFHTFALWWEKLSSSKLTHPDRSALLSVSTLSQHAHSYYLVLIVLLLGSLQRPVYCSHNICISLNIFYLITRPFLLSSG